MLFNPAATVQVANVKDPAYGAIGDGIADDTAAIAAAIAALPNGGIVWLPAGNYKITSAITISTGGITIMGASRNGSQIITNSTTADMFVINQFYVGFENLTLTTTVVRTAGYAINTSGVQSYSSIRRCNIYGTASFTMFAGHNMTATLAEIEDLECRFFTDAAVVITSGGDKRINRLVTNNAVQSTSGVRIISTTSLLLSNSNIITSGNALDLVPGAGQVIPSIECVNCFFDSSVIGAKFNPNATGNILRSKFTSCWFSSHSVAGVQFTASGASIDGITFDNCDFYGSVNGVSILAAVGGITISNSRIAGNSTAGINVAASSASTQLLIGSNTIGTTGGFGVNATGIILATGTYGVIKIDNNQCVNNTAVISIGTITIATASNYAIINNSGINVGALQTAPAIGASPATITNTTGRKCVVYVSTAGTTSAWSVGGQTTGAATYTAGACLGTLPPGQTITVTYTIVPVLKWIDA